VAKSICLVSYDLALGGAQHSLTVMANYWASKGHSVKIILLAKDLNKPSFNLRPEIEVIALDVVPMKSSALSQLKILLSAIVALRKTLKKLRPKVIISFLDWVNVVTLLSGATSLCPVIISERIDPQFSETRPIWKFLRYLSYPFTSALVVLSAGCANYFNERVRAKTHIIPNPFVISEPKSNSDLRKQEIICMGRLLEQKGFDLALHAFKQVAHKHPDWQLTIYGEGELRQSLTSLRDHLELNKQVSFPGIAHDPSEPMSKASIFVLSSRYEGFPRVLGEAMLSGLPVISFDCPSGPSEIVRHGTDGILVPAEDITCLATAMDLLMSDIKMRQSFGEAAISGMERFSEKRVMPIWDELISKLCAE